MIDLHSSAPTVVLIDEDPQRHQALRTHLESAHSHVISVDSITKLRDDSPPDVVVVVISATILLPDVAAQVNLIHQLTDAFVCGLAYPEQIEPLLAGGVDDLLLSPFPPALLAQRIQRIWWQPSQERQISNALRHLTASLLQSLDLDIVIEHVLTLALEVFPAVSTNLMLIDDDGMVQICKFAGSHPASYQGLLDKKWPATEYANLNYMIEHRQPFIITDVTKYAEWADVPETKWIRAYLGAPIMVDNGVIGFINLDHDEPFVYDEHHAQNLQAFADQIAIAVRNARLHSVVMRHAEELEQRVEERTTELRDANDQLRHLIIERQAAEANLDNERQLLRTLLDHLPDEVFIKDMEGNIVTANSALMKHMGLKSLSELDNPNDITLCASDVAARLAECDAIALGGEMVSNREMPVRYRCQDEYRSMLITRIPLKNRFGYVVGTVGINRDVTEIKRAQQRLDDVIERVYCVLWQATVHAVEKNAKLTTDWEMRIINEEAAQNFLQLSLSAEQPLIYAWADAILDYDTVKTHSDAAILRGDDGYQVEFRYCRADGEVRWLHEEVKIRTLGENQWELVGVSTDVTERKHAEFNLQRANELLEQRVRERTIELSRSNDVLREQIAVRQRAEQAERNQRIIAEALRESALALSGTLKLTEVLDRLLISASSILPNYDVSSIDLIEDSIYVRTIRYLARSDDGSRMEVEHERHFLETLPIFNTVYRTAEPFIITDAHQDDRWIIMDHTRWVRSYVCVPITVEGRVIGFLSMSANEPNLFHYEHANALLGFSSQAGAAIQNARLFETTQRYAQDLRQRVAERTAELELERAQLRAILDSMTEGVVYFDSHGRLSYVNPSLVAMTGITEEEWLNTNDGWKSAYVGDDESAQDFIKGANMKLARFGIWKNEMKLRHRDGSLFDASLVCTLVHSRGQAGPGAVIVLRDISAEKRLEAQKARFIATASHELRTPITNMKTRLYLIEKRPELIDSHLDVLATVTDRMRQLVDDLLDMSRFENGMITLTLQPTPLFNVVQSVVMMQAPEAEMRELTVEITLPDEPVELQIDPYRIEQVFTNLLSNAINYTPKGGRITIDAAYQIRDGRDYVAVSVHDTGIGIPANLLNQVFTPFFRVRENNTGSGLGLSISREIVERHGGDITVSSVEGQGTTFVVWLPLVTETQASERAVYSV